MLKKWMIGGGIVAAGAIGTTLLFADSASDLKAAVDKSMKAMGASNVKTFTLTGEGFDTSVGQQCNPKNDWWRKFSDKNYVRAIDLNAKGWHITRTHGEGEPNSCGGAGTTNPAPVQEQNTVTTAAPANFNNYMGYVFLPEGFLQTALDKNGTVGMETKKGKKFTVISFTLDNGTAKAPVKGYIDEMGYVTRVETMINGQEPIGDAIWSVDYDGYKDWNGFKFPTSIVERQGPIKNPPQFAGMTVSNVSVNQPVDLAPPAGRGGAKGGAPGGGAKGGDGKAGARGGGKGGDGKAAAKGGDAKGGPPAGGRGGGGAAQAVTDEDLGGGFWLVTGGYGAVVANFKNYIVVIEGPQNDMRGEQVIAEAKKLAPNKPIKYVINTHSHFDHAGGLRPFVAEGATILTYKTNKGYYEALFANPHTLAPDRLSMMNPQPKTKVEYVGEKKILTDGEHTIEMDHLLNSMHSDNMLIVYLPKQKILVEADEFNVLNPIPTAPVPMPNQYQVNLLANIERLKLDVARIIPVHLPNPQERKVPLSELRLAAGKPAN
ncbi:MAG TPA: MBL fold metallo-hydrolase [Bryobacteraceae bacterium]|jgi:glyoxylase-like metal-dependent hydrolase (beta-lactamase superfamily II)